MAAHLNFEERKLLHRLLKEETPAKDIARIIGRHRSSIYRELARNTGGRGYRPKQAQRLADERRLACRRPHKLEDAATRAYVRERIEKCWSPDQIAGRSRRDFRRKQSRWVSHQTIYNWIHD